MTAQVIVTHKWAKITDQDEPGVVVVDTTSKADDWRRDLSPFHLGPCNLYDGIVSQNMENAWQFAKVYSGDTDEDGNPTRGYWAWARLGWADETAHRYPKGRGAVPEYSLWNGQRLDYIEARKQIYAPLYAEAVQRTEGFQRLVEIYESVQKLYLRDWDGWNMAKHGMATYTDVLNNPRRKMGHAFVLAMLLTQDPALQQCAIRSRHQPNARELAGLAGWAKRAASEKESK